MDGALTVGLGLALLVVTKPLVIEELSRKGSEPVLRETATLIFVGSELVFRVEGGKQVTGVEEDELVLTGSELMFKGSKSVFWVEQVPEEEGLDPVDLKSGDPGRRAGCGEPDWMESVSGLEGEGSLSTPLSVHSDWSTEIKGTPLVKNRIRSDSWSYNLLDGISEHVAHA